MQGADNSNTCDPGNALPPARRLRPRLRSVGIRIALVLLLGIVGWRWFTAEPEYQGRPVSAWFHDFSFPPGVINAVFLPTGQIGALFVTWRIGPNSRTPFTFSPAYTMPPGDAHALTALKALGPAAVPHLLSHFLHSANRIKTRYAALYFKAPPRLARWLPQPSPANYLRERAAEVLVELGTDARAAMPRILAELADQPESIDPWAVRIVRAARPSAEEISQLFERSVRTSNHRGILTLVESIGLRNRNCVAALETVVLRGGTRSKQTALSLLTQMGPEAAPALPTVIKVLSHPDGETRYQAALVLDAIGLAAAPAQPALVAALRDTNLMVRNRAARALERIRDAAPPSPAPKAD